MQNREAFQIQGNNLSVIAAGDKNNPLALFLHGIPASAELWKDTLEKVSAQGWYCLAPDLPGYGQTRMKKGADYSVKGTAKFLLDWIQQENFKDIWLIGHDIGGGVAQLMMTRQEALFTKVTLSNCATAKSWPVPFINKLIRLARLGLYAPLMGWNFFPYKKAYPMLKKIFINAESLNEEKFQRIFYDGKFSQAESRKAFQNLLSSLRNRDTMENMEALAKVKLPVHLVWAMDDPFQSWEKSGKILAETLPQAKISQLDKTGHFLQIDSFEKYITALLEDA